MVPHPPPRTSPPPPPPPLRVPATISVERFAPVSHLFQALHAPLVLVFCGSKCLVYFAALLLSFNGSALFGLLMVLQALSNGVLLSLKLSNSSRLACSSLSNSRL